MFYLQIILKHKLLNDTNIIGCLLYGIIPILLYDISFTNLNLEKNLLVNQHIKISRIIIAYCSLLKNNKMLVQIFVGRYTSYIDHTFIQLYNTRLPHHVH